jgi:transposase
MSQRERDRLKVLHEVEEGRLVQREAAGQLGMSERGLRKLLKRYRSKKDLGVVHGLRGGVSKRRVETKTAARVVQLVASEYADFGPTLTAEYLEREHQIELSRETVRKLMVEAGLWRAKPRKVKTVHEWREPRSCRGELVQWDTSVHAWLEERHAGPLYLVALIDDATKRLYARFVEGDTAEENLRVFWGYLIRYGRPQAVYTDKASIFQPTLAPGWKSQEAGEKTETQIGRALRELGVEWIGAHSPQAKGRVERCFGTLQDRLVKALRKANIRTREQANRFLEETFLPDWNQRFAVPARNEVDAHRSLQGLDLAATLCHKETRRVANDYTISWHGKQFQIPKEAVKVGLRGRPIEIQQRLDGRLMARIGEEMAALSRCGEGVASVPAEPAKPAGKRYVPKPGQSRWMEGFRVGRTPEPIHGVPPNSAQLRSPSGLPPPG